MTTSPERTRPRTAWAAFMPIFFRSTPHRFLRALRRRATVPFEEVVITGRISGTERGVMLTIAESGGRLYVSHPDGARTHWVENLRVRPDVVIVRVSGERAPYRAVPLHEGPERTAAVERLIAVQRPPVNVVYRAARRHIHAEAQVFRLDPASADA